MLSLKIGHYTDSDHATGLTVFLFTSVAVGVYHLCGSSPATRELHVLDFEANAAEINGLVLTGGSAFGLGAVDGVMQYLLEQGLGKNMPHGGVVPIVPAAAIYDLAIKAPQFPNATHAYQACLMAEPNNPAQGRVGAGTGASVGKLMPDAKRMTGGFGFAEMKLENGVIVRAYAVVNSVGDIRDATGKILAGARLPDDTFGNCENYLLSGDSDKYDAIANTTLVAVFTNAHFSKIELKRIAKMAVAGMGRAISPVFTRYDGDIIFCVSIGEHIASELTVGTIAAEVVRQAIVNSVKDAVNIYDEL